MFSHARVSIHCKNGPGYFVFFHAMEHIPGLGNVSELKVRQIKIFFRMVIVDVKSPGGGGGGGGGGEGRFPYKQYRLLVGNFEKNPEEVPR